MKTVKFFTLGCKVNQYDTQSIRERFINSGFKEINHGSKASFYVVNTCTVTSSADSKSRNLIRHCIKENPRARLLVTGCLAENDHNDLAKIKGIDFIISKRFFSDGISSFCGRTRAFLKIQDGCDNFCSYCKVPLVRGRSRSRAKDLIIEEAHKLVKNGFKEIVLTGVCLGAYGRDLSLKNSIVDVIEELEKIEGLLRIRLSSIETGDVTDVLIEKMSQSSKLCRHLHIPIQSGDNEVLKKMNRKYTRQDYLNLIHRIKNKIPDIAITTDVLVGFPAEKEGNFQNTINLIKEVLPLKVHIFPYSRREGVFSADNFKYAVRPDTVKERILRLKNIALDCASLYRKRFLNKKMGVLIEGYSKEKPTFWEGYTDNYISVAVKSALNVKNQIILVRLKEIIGDYVLVDLD